MNEKFLFEQAARGALRIKKAEALLAELLEEHGEIDNIPEAEMSKVRRIASSGAGFLDAKGEIWQHHPH